MTELNNNQTNNKPETQPNSTDNSLNQSLDSTDAADQSIKETTPQQDSTGEPEAVQPPSEKIVKSIDELDAAKADELTPPPPNSIAADGEPSETPVRDPDEVITVDTLDDAPVYNPEDFEELYNLYEKSLLEISEGELIRGRIVAIGEKEIAVDIGFKAEGTIPLDEFLEPDSLKIGDEITVFLDKIEDQEGQLVLSKRKADFMETWEKMLRFYETQEVIQGRITRRIKGGMVVDIFGIDAFLPGSQIDIHPIRDFDALVGRDMDFRIVKINELRKNIVLSHKVLIEESLAEVREKILLDMDVGAVMEGTVKNITDFGVFVDLGGVDGLLHITDLSWGRISHPSEIVSLDEKITVIITDIDPVRKRVSIGYKQLQPHPWEGLEERYPVNSKITGKVVSITNYGAFIELEKGVEGLIHVSEMSWTQHIKHPSTLLSIGDEIEAVVLSMDVADRKISLGMKQIEPDPWEKLEMKYSAGSKHQGLVRELVPFGAFVELEEGVEGLVHISDLSWTRKVRHPGEIVKKGQKIDVVILGFDRNERRIALGHKQIEDSPWNRFETAYAIGISTTGKVVRLIDKGVIVVLPDNVEGFVPNSQLGRDEEGFIRSRLNLGDELELIVVEFEKEAKRIVLSATEARRLKEKADYEEFLKTQEGKPDATKREGIKKPKTKKPAKETAKIEDADKPKKKPIAEKTKDETSELEKTETAEKPPEKPKPAVELVKPEEPEKPAKKPRAKKSKTLKKTAPPEAEAKTD
ncbi:MAG: 30S ribosomal protein S1, partial [candidate division Zixibacteria bacterium]|nr:30S ribosomal protein S1 [Candidatus Tariuqbacter arcticus]